MTTKERRLVFTYSKLCNIEHELEHCVSLLRSDNDGQFDDEKDENIAKIRNGIADVGDRFHGVRVELETIVNEMTDYGVDDEYS